MPQAFSRYTYNLLFLLLFIMAILACNQSVEPIATVQVRPTVANTETATIPLTPTDEPTLSPPPAPTPQPTWVNLSQPPDNLADLSQWLRDAYTAGAILTQVCELLRTNQWQRTEDSCQQADLNNDLQVEWLLTIDTTRLAEAEDILPAIGHWGDFWVVSANFFYKLYDEESVSLEFTAPRLSNLIDMNGDGWLEIIALFELCGASTCFNNYYVLSVNGDNLVNLVLPRPENSDHLATISLSYVTAEQFQDETGDGLLDLIIHGGTFGSVGAGLHRAHTEVWAWNGEGVALADIIWDQSDIRFHRLYDGNFAFDKGDFEAAVVAYTDAIENEALIDDSDWLEQPEALRGIVRQFAAFRLALIALLNHDFAEAVRWLNWLQLTYPATPLTQAADLLISEWDGNGNQIALACGVVTTYLATTENPTGPLVDMGYANPTLTGDDVCPSQ